LCETACEANCQEWSEDEIYNLCVKRLSALSEALRLKVEEKMPVVDKYHGDKLSKKEIKDIIDDTVRRARYTIDLDDGGLRGIHYLKDKLYNRLGL